MWDRVHVGYDGKWGWRSHGLSGCWNPLGWIRNWDFLEACLGAVWMMGWTEDERSGRETRGEAVVTILARRGEGSSQNSGVGFLRHLDFLRFPFTFAKFNLSYFVCLSFFKRFCFMLWGTKSCSVHCVMNGSSTCPLSRENTVPPTQNSQVFHCSDAPLTV